MDRREFLKILGGAGAALALPSTALAFATKELVVATPHEIEAVRSYKYRGETILQMGVGHESSATWMAMTPEHMIMGPIAAIHFKHYELSPTPDATCVVEISLERPRGYGVARG